MVKKHKKLIIILAIFFLSFNIVTDYKQKEAQAVFVIDDVTLVVLGLTVLATGVIAASNSQVKHMGSRVWNRLVDMGVTSLDQISKMDHSKNRNIIMNDLVVDAVTYVAEHLPTIDVTEKAPSIQWEGNSLNLSGYLGHYDDLKTGDIFFKTGLLNRPSTLKVGYGKNGTFTGSRNVTVKENQRFIFGYGVNSNGITGIECKVYDVNNVLLISEYITSFDFMKTKDYYPMLQDITSLDSVISGESTPGYYTIPYSDSKIKQNYNPTLINQNIPWTRGIDDLGNATSIGAIATNSPVVTDLATRDITKDVPLTWNDVKTGFVEKTITNDVVTDKVIDGTVTDGTVTDGIGTIDKVVDKVFSPTTTKTLDFSPLQLSLSDKFPFCIPFDFIRVFNIFTSNAVTPNFIITMPENLVGGGSSFEFNFNKFEKLAAILRFFVLLFFITNLIKYTRDLISH